MLRAWLMQRAFNRGKRDGRNGVRHVPRFFCIEYLYGWEAGFTASTNDFIAKYGPHHRRRARLFAQGYAIRRHRVNPAFRWPHPDT